MQYADVVDTILGDLRPPGDPRVNALRGGPPPSFADGAGMPPPPPGPGGPSFAQASGMPMQPPGGPMAGPGGPPPAQTPPKPPGGPPGLPRATGRGGPPLSPGGPPAGGVPSGPLGGPGSVMPLPPAAPVDPLLQRADELYAERKRLLEADAETYKPVDRKAMEDAYGKRQAGGEKQTMLALAAQQAGEGFAPMQAHFLKQAAAAREPMKMTGGTMTAEGFVEDPGHAAELAAKRSDAKLKVNEMALQQNLTAQERRRLEIVQSQDKQRHEALLLKLGEIRAGAAGKTGAGEARDWRTEDSMGKQFDAMTKDYTAELDATRKLGSLAPGRRPSAVEQGGMIMLLNKFLDPGSVVREGEYDRVARQQGLVDRASNFLAAVTAGEPLSDKLVADIRQMAALYEKAASGKIQAYGDEYAAKAYRRGLDPQNVIVNPYYKHTDTAAPQSGARGAPSTGPVKVGSPAEAAKLPKGTAFITPDGQTRVRQ